MMCGLMACGNLDEDGVGIREYVGSRCCERPLA